MHVEQVDEPRSEPLLGSRVRILRASLTARPFLKNVSIMLSGAVGGQMISILLSPILTRLYSPQQFGIMSVYMALVTILVVVASLRYEMTLPLANSDEDAINLVAVCGCALIVTTLVVAIATFSIPEDTVESLWPTPINWLHVAGYRILLVIGFFCLGLYFIALYFATRQGAFSSIALTRVFQGVVGPTTQIGFALVGVGAPGLIVGSILGQAAGSGSLLFGQIRKSNTHLRKITWHRMMSLARRFRRFPLISSWAALVDAAGGNQLLYLLVALHYSAHIAGFIFLAERVVARPLSMIGTSILQVYVGEAGKTVSAAPEKLRKRFYQVVSRQFMMALVWIVLANIGATLFFDFVFGDDWGDAVFFLRAISLAYFVQAVVLPVFHTLQILEKQTLAASWQIGRLALIALTFFLADYFDISAVMAIFCYSLAQAFSCIVLFALMAKSIENLQKVNQ